MPTKAVVSARSAAAFEKALHVRRLANVHRHATADSQDAIVLSMLWTANELAELRKAASASSSGGSATLIFVAHAVRRRF